MRSIYLDVCCLNRPFDDQAQDRIRLEAEAVMLVLRRVTTGEWQWIGSEVVGYEVDRTPDPHRRSRVRALAATASEVVRMDDVTAARAGALEALGLDALDALHVACAERGGAEVLLTTDDRLVRRAARAGGALRVRVANVLTWLGESMT